MHQAAIKSLRIVGDELKQNSLGRESTHHEHTGKEAESPNLRDQVTDRENQEAQREDARNIITQSRVNKSRYAWDEENYEDKEKEMGALCFT
jgi:hypothetical protein